MLEQWAKKYSVSSEALEELRASFGCVPVVVNQSTDSESRVQAEVRLEAAKKGIKLWRNNVGVLQNERGQYVRYGLANDSVRLNKVVKSGDLIGWRPILIQPEHQGKTISQFVSREVKAAGWKYSGNPHELAQLKWIQAVIADGGDACFASGEGTL